MSQQFAYFANFSKKLAKFNTFKVVEKQDRSKVVEQKGFKVHITMRKPLSRP